MLDYPKNKKGGIHMIKILFLNDGDILNCFKIPDENLINVEQKTIMTGFPDFWHRTVPIHNVMLDLKECGLEQIALDEAHLKAIGKYNLSIENKILKKDNERLALELELKEKKLGAIKEAFELYAEYLKSDFGDYKEFLKDKYDGCW